MAESESAKPLLMSRSQSRFFDFAATNGGDLRVGIAGYVQLTERRTALQRYLLIGLGGALGSVARYWVGSTVGGRMGVRFPYGTLVVNLTACLVIGFTLTWLSDRAEISPAWRYMIAVGFIGAYSTFSTFEWETLSTLRSGALALASLYAVGSLILGLAATWCGAALAEAL
ncbi:MAG TPA: fluoride efflux transporter CrcB [Terracidiphilus sp.]|nr:fluoride efflux transporter CrcB [Terracidiphilus sp.]